MTAQRVIARLLNAEMEPGALDRQRVLRDARLALQVAVQRGDAANIEMRKTAAVEAGEMWGVSFARPIRP